VAPCDAHTFSNLLLLLRSICPACISILIAVVLRDLGKRPFFPVEAGLHGIVPWVGRQLLGIRQPIDFEGYSGDSLFDWVEHFCFVAAALIGALIWSMLDSKRTDYRRLHAWLNLFLRLTLAAIMFLYGFDKSFPFNSTPSTGWTWCSHSEI